MDEFHAVLTAKHDEGLAYIRDFVRRSDFHRNSTR